MSQRSVRVAQWLCVFGLSCALAGVVVVLARRLGPPTQEEAETRMREAVRRSLEHYLGSAGQQHTVYVEAHPLLPGSYDGICTCRVEVVTRGEFVRRFGKPGKRPFLTVVRTRLRPGMDGMEWTVSISSSDVACPPGDGRWHSHGSVYAFPARFGAPDPGRFSCGQWIE